MTLWNRLRHWLHRDQATADLEEEMRLHMELRARRMAERGLDPHDAHWAARRQFGNPAGIQDASAAEWGWQSVERLAQDTRQAWRTLRQSPGFAAFAVLTLALGLGVNTAIFSVVDGVMLRPLPYPEPGRLVSLWEENSRPGLQEFSSHGSPVGRQTSRRTTVSVANLADYRNGTQSFEGLAAYALTSANLTGLGDPERLSGLIVSPEFFSVLGTGLQMGRTFEPAEDRPGADNVVILTHEFWQQRLGGDPQILNRSIVLDGRARRVVGVLPEGFRSPFQLAVPAQKIQYYLPPALPAALAASHGDHEVNVVARLRPGVTMAAAQAELRTVSAQLAVRYPMSNRGIDAHIAPLATDLAGDVRQALLVLLAGSGLIVLITCVNIANLLLVRAIGRGHETSVRFALGASRARVIRQFLLESLLLAAGGCAAGLLLGGQMLRGLLALAPNNLPLLQEISMDWRVFAAGALVATLTGLAFGLAPAWHASTGKASDALRTASRQTGARSQTLGRTLLTAAEVALSLVLLTGAGLFLRSFVAATGVDLGLQPSRVLALNVNLPQLRYGTPEKRLQFYQELERLVAGLPGVESAAYANRMPLRGGWGGSVNPDTAPDTTYDVDRQAVSTGYFRTLGIGLLRGRFFEADDANGYPPVAIVDQTFARVVFGGADPIGRRVRLDSDWPWMTIVGVASNIRRGGKEGEYRPEIYMPAAQTALYPRVSLGDFAVRAAGDPRNLVNAIRQQVRAIDPDQPITNIRTLDEIIDASLAQRRFETVLLVIFAALAVGLAMLGVFGVLSYAVSQRTSELGIRIALGARPSGIVAMVLRQAAVLVGAGLLGGLAVSLVLSRFLASLLFHVKQTDLLTYATAVGLLAAISLAAALIPARRGSKIDPIRALRYE
jgi:putative ABC transport system permease protein